MAWIVEQRCLGTNCRLLDEIYRRRAPRREYDNKMRLVTSLQYVLATLTSFVVEETMLDLSFPRKFKIHRPETQRVTFPIGFHAMVLYVIEHMAGERLRTNDYVQYVRGQMQTHLTSMLLLKHISRKHGNLNKSNRRIFCDSSVTLL